MLGLETLANAVGCDPDPGLLALPNENPDDAGVDPVAELLPKANLAGALLPAGDGVLLVAEPKPNDGFVEPLPNADALPPKIDPPLPALFSPGELELPNVGADVVVDEALPKLNDGMELVLVALVDVAGCTDDVEVDDAGDADVAGVLKLNAGLLAGAGEADDSVSVSSWLFDWAAEAWP